MIALAGFCASMVDGALGMGFGPTSATILLSSGISPAATSATVNIAKVATGLAAGASHWKFENLDRRLVIRLALPGVVGAVVGATILANVDGDQLRPYLAALLMIVGLRIVVRFSRGIPPAVTTGAADAPGGPRFHAPGVEVAATAGGVTNGLIGAWGPVVTPFLLQRGVPARYAVGSANTAEIAVAVVSAGTLITSLGGAGIEIGVVLAMLIGGVLAAPLAAYVVRFFPPRLMALAVGGLLLITQSRELANHHGSSVGRWGAYVFIALAVVFAAFRPRLAARRRPAQAV